VPRSNWDGLRALLADDVKLNQPTHPFRVGRAHVGMFFIIYAKIDGVWLAPAWLEGREVYLCLSQPPQGIRAPTSANDLSREKAQWTETKFFPCQKTGGRNISRALGERDEVTWQEFERESRWQDRGVCFAYEPWGTQRRRSCECQRKRKTRLS
jgi:hypothetical protein